MTKERELLRRALNSLNNLEDQLKDLGYGWLGGPQLREEIETFLAAEPEAEPVEIVPREWRNTLQKLVFLVRFQTGNTAIQSVCNEASLLLSKPYLHPPRPEPETEEPVAWRLRLPLKNVWHFQDDQESVEALCLKGWIAEPLYPKPSPARKPMSGDEIVIAFNDWAQTYCFTKVKAFEIGVRFAEKHHGIGGDDER